LFQKQKQVMKDKLIPGTIVKDNWAFYPEDQKPKYVLLPNGKWHRVNENWIEYSIPELSVGEGQRFQIVGEPEREISDTWLLAEKIYETLRAKGAGIGNASIPFIKSVIEEHFKIKK
jgi:hypothetical protein